MFRNRILVFSFIAIQNNKLARQITIDSFGIEKNVENKKKDHLAPDINNSKTINVVDKNKTKNKVVNKWNNFDDKFKNFDDKFKNF